MAEHRKSEALLSEGGLFNSMRGANSTPHPVVTWTRSAASAGSHPIATSIATLTNVLVAPVSRAKRRMALPLGPLSSAPMTMRPSRGVNEKLTTRSQCPEASCPCRQSQTVWGGSRRLGGRPPRDPCHARAPFRCEPPGPDQSMGPRSVSTRSRILPPSRRSSGPRPSVALLRRIIEREPSPLLERLQHPRRGHRQLPQPDARGIVNCVGDHRSHGNDRRLAGAQRRHPGVINNDGLHFGHPGKARDLVAVEGPVPHFSIDR